LLPLLVILAAAGGGLLLAAPSLQAGGGGHGCSAPREGADEPVFMRASCFTPTILRVETGAEVIWENNDSGAPHNVTLFDGEVVGGDESLTAGESVSHAFASPGVYGYLCSIHPFMLGVVVVSDGGGSGAAVRADDASLSLEASAEPPGASAADADGDGLSSASVAGIALATGLVAVSGTAAALHLRRKR
jgi:plastocyanin